MMRRTIILVTFVSGLIPLVASAQSPGTIVGTTYMDMQSTGSTGNRVAVGSDRSVLVAWTNNLAYPRPRHVYFNYMDSLGEWYSPGFGERAFYDSVTGFCQTAMAFNHRGVIATYTTSSAYSIMAMGYDYSAFGHFDIPDLIPGTNKHCIWPSITVDRNNYLHVVMNEMTSPGQYWERLCYTRVELDSMTWWPNLTNVIVIDTVYIVSAIVAASPVSDKVVIAYCHPQDTLHEFCSDIFYILSENGIDWDFANGKVNLTNYGADNDSLWGFVDLDVIFDYNDSFHIIWNANWTTAAGYHRDRTYLFHYGSLLGFVSEIRPPWPDSSWIAGCDYGAYNRTICKMNMGVRPNDNRLYAVWTQYDTSDCSAGGYANGDIWMAYSDDGGSIWNQSQNLTNSHTPGCAAGDCDSDIWPSLADIVDSRLHLFYLNDKDAGSVLQYEGSATQNPMLYFSEYSDVGGKNPVAQNFFLGQNYPNPFNAKTAISFELTTPAHVRLDIYNLTGEKVANLINGEMPAGSHRTIWNANQVASGMYFYRLTAGKETQTKQMVLIK